MTAGRAVVTGLSVVAPNGVGVEAFWAALLRGESGIGPVTRFDATPYRARLAGEITDFDPVEHVERRLLPQTDRMTRLALAASDWALRDADLDPDAVPAHERAVVTAATGGGYEFGQRELQKLWREGPDFVSAYQSFAWFYAVNTGQISIRHGTKGPGAVLANEQAGGLDAIGHARRHLRRDARLVLTGGVDSALCPWAWVAHQVSGGMSTAADPTAAYLPFDRRACGHVPGEGGAILVLERGGQDRAGYGEIAGYAATFDSPRRGRPPALRRAAQAALADAGVPPGEVDVVFADAAGTPEADRVEAEAITALFGPRGVAVTAPKTTTGRLGAGGGPLDVAAALLAIRDGVVPPTVHVRDSAHPELDLVLDEPRHGPVRTALVLARGHRGFNAAIVVRAVRS